LSKKIYIIVPSYNLDSPVKGAVALANGLIEYYSVTFISLKKGSRNFPILNSQVEKVCLEDYGTLFFKLFKLRKIIKNKDHRNQNISISFCLSADFFNSFCNDIAYTISSVRGNLPEVYQNSFGFFGKSIAKQHLRRLSKVNQVLSLTNSMSRMVESYTNAPSYVIGNFIDEAPMEFFRRTSSNDESFLFVYTGSLTSSKKPELLINSMDILLKKGISANLEIFGDGPLLSDLKKKALLIQNPGCIKFFGYVEKPFGMLARADAIVLPSLTEGVSRSALEALYLGVPCIMRDADGNSELITSGINGELFCEDEEIADAMVRAAKISRSKKLYRKILVPEMFRQKFAINKYIQFFNLNT
jgi:glycosyltransferase involved in cell wall biosynthesis